MHSQYYAEKKSQNERDFIETKVIRLNIMLYYALKQFKSSFGIIPIIYAFFTFIQGK